jgi:hypothetical protein
MNYDAQEPPQSLTDKLFNVARFYYPSQTETFNEQQPILQGSGVAASPAFRLTGSRTTPFSFHAQVYNITRPLPQVQALAESRSDTVDEDSGPAVGRGARCVQVKIKMAWGPTTGYSASRRRRQGEQPMLSFAVFALRDLK